MPVFRVEKNKDFTVMSNHHLRNQNISLKAKGLLSQMLSLPPDWDYTLAGLAAINLEGVDAIREAVRELEKAGYITREQKRASGGHFSTNVYVIREVPLLENPITVNPATGNPMAVTPITDHPMTDNPTEISKEGANTERQNTDCINNQSNQIRAGPLEKADRMRLDRNLYRAIVKENIEYDILRQEAGPYADDLDEIVEIMVETVCAKRKFTRVAGSDFPHEVVKSRLLKLNCDHVRFVMDCMRQNTTKIRNIKQYLLAALFNAPTTMSNYYTSLVNHDMYGG